MATGSCRRAARTPRRLRLSLLLGVLGVLLAASPASAHGIEGEAAQRSVLGFVPLGIEHMLLGWDHLLFIVGVVLLAGEGRRAAKLITVFVVGHSLTLIVATLAGWQVNATAVDVVIALSVVYVGAFGMIVGRPERWNVFTGVVLVFGLVHGLGLATRFHALGVAEDGILWRVIAFNVGIEIGQLSAIAAVLALAVVLRMVLGRRQEPALRQATYAVLLGVGAAVAPYLAFMALTGSEDAAAAGGGCVVGERTEDLPGGGGGHTERTFFEPEEEAPLADLGHSLADGYVVVLYGGDLTAEDLDQLRAYATGHELKAVLAGAHPEPTAALEVHTVKQTMTCEQVDIEALEEFSADWLTSVGAQ